MQKQLTCFFISACIVVQSFGAGFSENKTTKANDALNFISEITQYAEQTGEAFTAKTFEKYGLQRKMTFKERLMFKAYQKQKPEGGAQDEATLKKKNKTLSWVALGLYPLSVILLFTTLAPAILFLWPIAFILGIIVTIKAKKFSDISDSGYGLGFTSIILGSLGILLVVIALIAFSTSTW